MTTVDPGLAERHLLGEIWSVRCVPAAPLVPVKRTGTRQKGNAMTIISTEECALDFEGDPCDEPTEAECELYIGDRLRARLAELGGRVIRQTLSGMMPEADPTLSYAYGRAYRFTEHRSASSVWFQPADGTPALRLVIPSPFLEAIELSWAACDALRTDRVIITAEAPGSPVIPGRCDATLVAIALTAPEDFGQNVTVVTDGYPRNTARSYWPEQFTLFGPLVQL
jgi:hypothetical protein